MPPIPRREQNKARTRMALVAAAVRLFEERGYERTTIEEIADAAGSSPSTFFRYFGTKEDVLFFDVPEIMNTFTEFVSQPVPGLDRWEQIKAGMHMSVRRLEEPDSPVTEFILRSWLFEPAVSARFAQFARETEQVIATAMADARGTDPNRDGVAQLAARSATAVYMTTFHLHLHTRRPLNDLLAETFEALATGIPTIALCELEAPIDSH